MKLSQTCHFYGTSFTVLFLTGIGSVPAATGTLDLNRYSPVAERVMSCEAPVEFRDRHRIAGLDTLPDTLQSGTAISLIRQAQGQYDVRVGEDSVSTLGTLSGLPGDMNPVHLVLDTAAGTEHFLFMQNPDGSGELLWSSATASALTTCIAAD